MSEHRWAMDGHDTIGNAIDRCVECGVRKIENCSTFWQVAKGRRWTDEENAEIPPCTGKQLPDATGDNPSEPAV
jgi:hypothetical protein